MLDGASLRFQSTLCQQIAVLILRYVVYVCLASLIDASHLCSHKFSKESLR